MKLFVVLACINVAAAVPQRQVASKAPSSPQDVKILRQCGLGSYTFAYELSDQTKREEQGEFKNGGTDDELVAVKGSYSWVGPDGLLYTVNYVADENGFQLSIDQPPDGAIPPGEVTSLLVIEIKKSSFVQIEMARTTKNNTGEIVLSAIKKLMKNTGWTTRTIIKFIKMEYRIRDPNIGRKVSRALKRGIKLGLLQMEHGRYRLNGMSRIGCPVAARKIRLRQRPKQRTLRMNSGTPSRKCNY